MHTSCSTHWTPIRYKEDWCCLMTFPPPRTMRCWYQYKSWGLLLINVYMSTIVCVCRKERRRDGESVFFCFGWALGSSKGSFRRSRCIKSHIMFVPLRHEVTNCRPFTASSVVVLVSSRQVTHSWDSSDIWNPKSLHLITNTHCHTQKWINQSFPNFPLHCYSYYYLQ